MSKLLKEWLADDAIDGQVLSNNDFVQGRNAADNANVDMLKINASDKIELGADLQMGSFNILTSGLVDGVDVATKGTNVSNLVTLSGVAADSTSLGTFSGTVVPDSQNIKQALQALETYSESTRSLVQSFEWYKLSALDYVTDNTLAPVTEVLGDVYVLSHDGGVPHASYDGAAAGSVVYFDGSLWIATVPTTGMMISVDDETTSLRQWSGSAWTQKSFETTTASTGLTKVGVDVRIANAAAANGISITSGAVSAVLNASHLEIASNAISIKSNAIGETELNNVDGAVDADSLVLSSGYLAAAGTPTIGDSIEVALEKIVGNATADYSLGSDSFSGDGSTTDFVTTNNLKSASGMWVTIDGVMRVITTDYTVNVGINTISFLTAPALGQSINIKYFK